MLKNAKHLFSERDYSFYLLDEIGFSHKKLAYENELYENFGDGWRSTFEDIFQSHLYEDNQLSQVWIFYQNKPIGLSIAVHDSISFTNTLTHRLSGLSTEILGQIHLFVKPSHRGQGLSLLTIKPLEEALFSRQTRLPPSIILSGHAWRFRDEITKGFVLPYAECDLLYHKDNPKFLCHAFKGIFENNERLMTLLNTYQEMKQNITDIDKTKQIVQEFVVPKFIY